MSSNRPSTSARAIAAAVDQVLPTRIGDRYDVVERLGQGGMAIVYRVGDRSHRNLQLALKQLVLSGSTRDRETRALFEREFHVLSELRHPNVVAVHDFGVDVAGPYYTMELLDSADLGMRAPWPWKQACGLMMQLCSALSLLHSRRLVHRDISPRNVRCTRDGEAKLIDFGAMVPMGPCAQGVGTPGFIAPEVVQHLALDARTDLFSLGATLYHALTGTRPFAARTMAELSEAWRTDPVAPSALVASIPGALDTLVLSLLRLDPARRPSSAFEVMQRLAAIAGQPITESAEVARAYLVTPVLVGREAQQLRFRQTLRQVAHGDGGGVLVEAASGLGRTRLLEACVREAKTSGATVLRLAGRAARAEAFSAAHDLAAQLLEALPDEAGAAALRAGVQGTLLCPAALRAVESPDSSRTLRAPESMAQDAYPVRDALVAWFLELAKQRFLVITVDDVERIDDASLTMLVALVQQAAGTRLLLVSTLQTAADADEQPALGVLRSNCLTMPLSAFSASQTDALFRSMFFDAPHTTLVGNRIHRRAAGNPRQTLALAQHLLDKQLIRFSDGNWVLPAELALNALPINADEALGVQLASLPQLSRFLAETQALALEGPWTRNDYAVLAAASGSAESLDDALASLLGHGVIVENAGTYTLTQVGTRRWLVSQVAPADRAPRELALAGFCAMTARHGLMEVYHLQQGKAFGRALARLARVLEGQPTVASLPHQSGVDSGLLVQILVKAHEYASAHGRSLRERHELVRALLELSTSDARLFYKYAPERLAQLERDSGLPDYRAFAGVDAAARLHHALQTAASRYAALPEDQRVYRVNEAIKGLALYVVNAIVIGARALDTALLASLPGLLEPFAGLSPILHALWQNAIAANEMNCQGRLEQARGRCLAVYEQLSKASEHDAPNIEAIRHAVAHANAGLEVMLGYPTAERWIASMEGAPAQRVAAEQFRRVLCVYDADEAGAEHHRQRAEVLAAQAIVKPMFDADVLLELNLQVYVRNLTGIKHAADRIGQLASQWPRWRSYQHTALAQFHLLRGDPLAAQGDALQALALENPDRTDAPPLLMAWVAAAASYVTVLTELGQLEEAQALGVQACERCDQHAITGFQLLVRALAIAEARLGHHASAAARLDELIAARAHLRPSQLALDFEARATVALWAKDTAAAAHFTQRAAGGTAAAGSDYALSLHRRLRDEAQKAGLVVELPLSSFETALLGKLMPANHNLAHPKVLAALGSSDTAPIRAERVLALLCEAAGACAGQLYYVCGTQLQTAAVSGSADPGLDRFVHGYFRHRQAEAALSTIFTAANSAGPTLTAASWTSPRGQVYRITPLSPAGEAACIGLVALPAKLHEPLSAEYWALSAAISFRLLELGDVAAAAQGT